MHIRLAVSFVAFCSGCAALACSALALCIAARASEQVDICAIYSNSGSSYHVTATAISGSELNAATHSFDYNSFGHYIVIFWAQGQATVIEMNSITGMPGPIQESSTDQEGRSWEISRYSPIFCGFQ
jgi:YD repeat-containing protein